MQYQDKIKLEPNHLHHFKDWRVKRGKGRLELVKGQKALHGRQPLSYLKGYSRGLPCPPLPWLWHTSSVPPCLLRWLTLHLGQGMTGTGNARSPVSAGAPVHGESWMGDLGRIWP